LSCASSAVGAASTRPDRDTLVQATAVTIIFVAVAATYLGALDAAFNYLAKQIL
jgi:preprotein translocase subunit SecE